MSLAPTASPTRRNVLEIADLDAREFEALLDLASTMHRHPTAWRHSLEGRTVACVLHAPSFAAHTALAAAVNRLGALPLMLTPDAFPEDDARMLSSACDGIVIHGARHRDLTDLAARATVPVVNACSREHDPVRGAGALSGTARAVRVARRPLDRLCRPGRRAGLLAAASGADRSLRIAPGLPGDGDGRPVGAGLCRPGSAHLRRSRRGRRRERTPCCVATGRLPTAPQPHRRCCTR